MTQLPAPERLVLSVSRVTETMLGQTFQLGEGEPELDPWRTVVLSIPGASPITVALSSDRRGCSLLAAAMLGMDAVSLDAEMIEDTLRELTNMTAGQLKTELVLDQALGLPRIADGKTLFAQHCWVHHVLRSDTVELLVSLIAEVNLFQRGDQPRDAHPRR